MHGKVFRFQQLKTAFKKAGFKDIDVSEKLSNDNHMDGLNQ